MSRDTRQPSGWCSSCGRPFPRLVRIVYAIFDRDSKYDADVITFLKATGLQAKQTSVQAPWQNGVAERWVGSCRREILDHVIPLNEEHLRRLLREFVNYYHQDRVHDSLGKDTPNRRPVEQKPAKKRNRRFHAAPGWVTPSLLLACGGLIVISS